MLILRAARHPRVSSQPHAARRPAAPRRSPDFTYRLIATHSRQAGQCETRTSTELRRGYALRCSDSRLFSLRRWRRW